MSYSQKPTSGAQKLTTVGINYGSISPQHVQLPYTPEQMKKVIQDALNDGPGPTTPKLDFEDNDHESDSSPCKGRSSFRETSGIPFPFSQSPGTSPVRVIDLRSPPRKHTDTITSSSPYPNVDSPIRPFYSPAIGTDPPKRTFEVDASFLEAIMKLLERQAMIVPDHLFTQDEVREIVRKELQNAELAKGNCIADHVRNEPPSARSSPLTHYVSLADVMMAAVSFAGMMVFRRAALAHPVETRWYALGALKGGFIGILGAVAVKGVLKGLDKLRGI